LIELIKIQNQINHSNKMLKKLPYSFLPVRVLRTLSRNILGISNKLITFFPFLDLNLKRAEIDIEKKDYLGMCLIATSLFFIFILFFLGIILFKAEVKNFYLVSLAIAIVVSLFIFLQQVMYPKIIASRRVKAIDKNLLSVLQNILVQLNSGVPLFQILVNVSKSDYGAVSVEFSKAVREINTGRHQIEVLEEMATKNPSVYFRRAVWQIVNGMKSGADMSDVITEVISALSEEQVIQIQRYGSQLNPLAMFYMLVAVILPALGTTFLIIISSFIALSAEMTKIVFWGLYASVLFFQIMFMGIIKTKRPNLLGD